jgi:hypothetical protein
VKSRTPLPLPSVCTGCRTTIHAIRNPNLSKVKLKPEERILWVHDVPLAVALRKGGSHSAIPDPGYAPVRGRVMGFYANARGEFINPADQMGILGSLIA